MPTYKDYKKEEVDGSHNLFRYCGKEMNFYISGTRRIFHCEKMIKLCCEEHWEEDQHEIHVVNVRITSDD